MPLKIVNETVYVIYRNGVPYDGGHRKLVYTSKGAASGVITKESYDDARFAYSGDWYELNIDEREVLTEKIKSEFTIIEYVPKNT